jgi:hemerythrin-like metal-binding protein
MHQDGIMTGHIEWNDAHSVGVESIDEQHRQLVVLTNRLFQAIVRDTGADSVPDVLTELERYVDYHFSHEEELLRKHGYPADALGRHIAEHRELTHQVYDFARKAREDSDIIDLEVFEFLRDWTTSHLLRTDMLYAGFLRSSGAR